MNIGIFYKKDHQEDKLEKIINEFKDNYITGIVFEFDDRWENIEKEELKFNLSSITHIIIIHHKNLFNYRWLSFLVGYSFAKKIDFFIYEEDKTIFYPNYISATIFHNINDLVKNTLTEKDSWYKNKKLETFKNAILKEGISINKDSLFKCIQENKLDIIEYFLNIDFSVNEESKNGIPLLVYAMRFKKYNIAKFLIENKADINLVAKDRNSTALIEACSQNNEDMVKYLLENGADPNKVNKNGQTALIIASGESNNIEIIKLLINKDIKIYHKDSLNMNALDYAKLFNRSKNIELIEKYIK